MTIGVSSFMQGKRLFASLDGGGVRGIRTLHALAALEREVGAPVGRLIEGGVGSYNDPAYAAAVEALR
ncbi:MAG: hypothetical protein ACYDCK_10910 [Thermoplasmatota archaeon]